MNSTTKCRVTSLGCRGKEWRIQRTQTAPANAAHLLVKPRLRSLVTFNCMNLARPGYIGRFDCIFCMDVLPHFRAPNAPRYSSACISILNPADIFS